MNLKCVWVKPFIGVVFLLKSLRKDVTAAERKVEDLAELRREEQVRTADVFISMCDTESCNLRPHLKERVCVCACVFVVLHRREQRAL